MTPAAKLRMDVYQEGQRAYNKGTPCPYSGWRAGTWKKGFDAAERYVEDAIAQDERDAARRRGEAEAGRGNPEWLQL